MHAERKPRAFAVAAHPDDIEFVMAGTLILLGLAGYELHYMNIANGCCGTTEYTAAEAAKIRAHEGQAAAQSIGAVFHPSLVNDLEIFYNHENLSRLAAVMREVAPEILLVHSPIDYMEDHMNACRLALTAAFARGMPNYPTNPARAPVDQPVTVYHAQPHGNRDPLGNLVLPGMYVDIKGVLESKTAMLACHASQKKWLDTSQGFDSYLTTMQDLSREVGRLSGKFEFAEGWRRHYPIGFGPSDGDPLAAALSGHVLRA
jgi:LmbE family N-acetylglucosaminyl deacetylase